VEALVQVGAEELLNLVSEGLLPKGNGDDRGQACTTPPTSVSNWLTPSNLSKALSLEIKFTIARLLETFRGIGAAGDFRRMVFEAYAARKVSEGGDFCIREVGRLVIFGES
jgi:hypothetical protein